MNANKKQGDIHEKILDLFNLRGSPGTYGLPERAG
jgi:hypothetical protein